jgi:DNA-binding transcriptional ArsR family regulator
MRWDGDVPSPRSLDAAYPEGVSTAMEIWGNPVRLLVFKYLRAHPGQVLGQIYDAVRDDVNELTGGNLIPTNLSRHLQIMREAGVVVTDLPADSVRGRAPRYSIDGDRADELLDSFLNYINDAGSVEHN